MFRLVGLELGSLGLGMTIQEALGRNSSGCGLENLDQRAWWSSALMTQRPQPANVGSKFAGSGSYLVFAPWRSRRYVSPKRRSYKSQPASHPRRHSWYPLNIFCYVNKALEVRKFVYKQFTDLCKVWDFHGGAYKKCRLLGCYAMWLLK
jgi:hypothetical protein